MIRRGRSGKEGQGFYTTDHLAFARRWARERRGCQTVVNTYELDPEGLKVRNLLRDEEWFAYIFANRAGRAPVRTKVCGRKCCREERIKALL